MDNPVTTPIELLQLINERGDWVVLLLEVRSVLADEVVETDVLPVRDAEEQSEQGLDQRMDQKIGLHEIPPRQGLCRSLLIVAHDQREVVC